LALKRGGYADLGKTKDVLGGEPTRKGESHRYAVGDEGAGVAEGTQDISLEAGECPESVHGPAWPRVGPRSAVK
jgi:hypothetical protein